MSTLIPNSEDHAAAHYAEAEGFLAPDVEADRRSWIYVGLGLVGLVAVIAALIAVVALATGNSEPQPVAAAPTGAHTDHAAAAPPPPPRPPPKRRA